MAFLPDRPEDAPLLRNGAHHRLRTLMWFAAAMVWAVFAQRVSDRIAGMLLPDFTYEAGSRLFYVVMLLVGFRAMAAFGQRHKQPISTMGLPRREGWRGEWLLGAKLGWAGIVVCVLPVALIGGLYVTLTDSGFSPYLALILDTVTLALAALADELVFRGYPFQRLIEVAGPGLATLLLSLLFAATYYGSGVQSAGGTFNTLLLGVLLATAYLRTKALWVSWGLHFAWVASMALLFGLPASGLTAFTPVISTYTSGPAWLTGGGYGPEGSFVGTLVLVGLMVVLVRSTGELKHRWAQPVIIGAGIPVDVDALAQKQHERGMGAAAAPAATPGLVQILPAGSNEPPRSV